MIHLTPKAVIKLKEFAEDEGMPLSIRVVIRGSGCAGFAPDMSLDDIVGELDEVLTQDGVKIIVDQMSIQYLDDATIDFIESEFASGFKFIIPQAKSSCGCGSSVSF